MTFGKFIAGLAVTAAVTANGAANAEDRHSLPPGSYEIAQVTDPGVYALQEEMRQLNGRIEELTFQLLELQEQMRRMQEDNEFRFQELERTDQTDAGGSAAPAASQDKDVAAVTPDPALPTVNQPQTVTGNASEERAAPPRNLGTLTIDGSGNIVGGDVDFSQGQIDSAIDGKSVASVATGGSAEDLYRAGYKHVLNGEYGVAEEIFRSLVEQYPDDPLVADARFWLAESVRGQGRLQEAAEIFIAVRTDYPSAQKAPETLLKIGQIMSMLGDRDVACVTFDDAEARYPSMSETVRTHIRDERAKAQC
ncbi:tol-pal system protein YbgF [Oricola cellulosilytica]|nr:tol-pal system protein YbgF [Oricola cellulosilytica]